MATYAVKGVILRGYPLGEHDRILVVLTAEQGIIRLVARGARKKGNRWGGRLEPLVRSEMMVARSRGALDVMTSVSVIGSNYGLLTDFDRLMAGMRLAEAAGCLVAEGQATAGAFETLVLALELLNNSIEPAAVVAWCELQLLDLCGYRPELGRCVACDREVPGGSPVIAFAVWGGGVQCQSCGGAARVVPAASIGLLRELQGCLPVQLARFAVADSDPEIWTGAIAVLDECITHNSGMRLKAGEICRNLAH